MSTEPIKYVKKSGSILRTIAIVTIALLIFGFLIDLFSGFYVLRNTKSIYAGLAGLFFLAVFYLIGEAGGDWISSKDDFSHPLYKRAFSSCYAIDLYGNYHDGWIVYSQLF